MKKDVNMTTRMAGDMPVIDLKDYVPAYLTFIANKWSRSASRLYLSRFGVGIEAWRIMVLLAIEGPITANHVVKIILMDKASVSRNFRAMHLAGLISLEDDPHDARQRFATLTPKGFSIHDDILDLAIARERQLLSCLSEDERKTLISLLARLHANLATLGDDDEED